MLLIVLYATKKIISCFFLLNITNSCTSHKDNPNKIPHFSDSIVSRVLLPTSARAVLSPLSLRASLMFLKTWMARLLCWKLRGAYIPCLKFLRFFHQLLQRIVGK